MRQSHSQRFLASPQYSLSTSLPVTAKCKTHKVRVDCTATLLGPFYMCKFSMAISHVNCNLPGNNGGPLLEREKFWKKRDLLLPPNTRTHAHTHTHTLFLHWGNTNGLFLQCHPVWGTFWKGNFAKLILSCIQSIPLSLTWMSKVISLVVNPWRDPSNQEDALWQLFFISSYRWVPYTV